MGDVSVLMEMGFPKERAEYALTVTNNKGVEPAMEWLLAHADEEIPASTTPAAGNVSGGNVVGSASSAPSTSQVLGEVRGAAAASETANTLKCDTCNKLFKDAAEAEFHAVKTLHSNFSESTEDKQPLTEEEKKAQLALIEQKLRQKRNEREEREKLEALEREKNRIKSGKDMTEARRVMEDLEMKKIVEQRKREKAEEKAAREKVKAQIEADKAARKARELKLNPDKVEPAKTVVSPTASTSAGTKSAPKEYTETRIQIRLQDGSSLQETFNVKEQLSAVRLYIQMKTQADFPFRMMTSFPRKVFTEEDYDKPLEALGLVPSAVIIITK